MDKFAILCVDDEEIILNSLASQLRIQFGERFTYEFAQGAEDAFEILEELQSEGCTVLVIVSDWLMPGIKGDEFLVQIHQRFPKMVKIMLTGQADAVSIERVNSGANLHRLINKPWSTKELVEAIESGLMKL